MYANTSTVGAAMAEKAPLAPSNVSWPVRFSGPQVLESGPASSSSWKWERDVMKLSGEIQDVLRNMPESARTRAVEDLTSVLNDLRQKLPGAGDTEVEDKASEPRRNPPK